MEAEEISEMTDGAAILRRWEEEHTDPHHDPIPILTRWVFVIVTNHFVVLKTYRHPKSGVVPGICLIHNSFFRLAEIIEADTESYMKMDPDPFDERHPSRADPTCNLGTILKIIFRKDNFMTKVTYSHISF